MVNKGLHCSSRSFTWQLCTLQEYGTHVQSACPKRQLFMCKMIYFGRFKKKQQIFNECTSKWFFFIFLLFKLCIKGIVQVQYLVVYSISIGERQTILNFYCELFYTNFFSSLVTSSALLQTVLHLTFALLNSVALPWNQNT